MARTQINIRTTEADKMKYAKVAKANKKTLSVWIRDLMEQAVIEHKEKIKTKSKKR